MLVDERLPGWRAFSPGLRLRLVETGGDGLHVFCGESDVVGGTCFLGRHPFMRLLSLDTSDARLGLSGLGVPFVHLLYCWTCEPIRPFTYSLEADGSVRVHGEESWNRFLLKMGKDPEAILRAVQSSPVLFPYEGYPRFFPRKRVVLEPLGAAAQSEIVERLVARTGESSQPFHQVGGLPVLVQPSRDLAPDCDQCGAPTTFVAAIGDDSGTPEGFTGNGWVQVLFFLCPDCRRVVAFNICD
jgi:hypothetical protein